METETIVLLSKREIEKMRQAGRLAARLLHHLEPLVKPGVTTLELDEEAERWTQAGMVFTIEPMINEGTWEGLVLEDGWTAITIDRKLSAQFEHTVAVTETGVEILTQYEGNY